MMSSWQQQLRSKFQQMSDMRSEFIWVPEEKELNKEMCLKPVCVRVYVYILI